jgi:TfoX/Sxy family transcriptional regulator of competence genes
MPYEKKIAERIEESVSSWNISNRKMFGGVCYLNNGNMMCGVYKNYLVLRLGPGQSETVLKNQYARPFDITGKPMKGWVMIAEDGIKGEKLMDWLKMAHTFSETLPKK